jgi:hypothetical protein
MEGSISSGQGLFTLSFARTGQLQKEEKNIINGLVPAGLPVSQIKSSLMQSL